MSYGWAELRQCDIAFDSCDTLVGVPLTCLCLKLMQWLNTRTGVRLQAVRQTHQHRLPEGLQLGADFCLHFDRLNLIAILQLAALGVSIIVSDGDDGAQSSSPDGSDPIGEADHLPVHRICVT